MTHFAGYSLPWYNITGCLAQGYLSWEGLDRGLHHTEPNAMQLDIHSQVEGSISRDVQLLADPLHAQVHLPRYVVLVTALLERQPGVVRLALMQPHRRHGHLHRRKDNVNLSLSTAVPRQ